MATAIVKCRQRLARGGGAASRWSLRANAAGARAATRKPVSAAAATMSGKGRAKK